MRGFKFLFLLFCILLNYSTALSERKIYAVVLISGKMIVGADNSLSGLFISSDDGNFWIHKGWGNIKATSIAIEPNSKGEVLYLTAGNGVLKSTDRGETWRIMTDWRVTEVLRVVIHPENKNEIFIATPYGVFKSVDSGWSWEEKNDGIKPEETGTTSSTFVSSIVIDRGNPSRILIGTEDGIYESLNRGERWKALALKGIGIRVLVQSPHNSDVLFAGTESDGIFKSSDGGKSWKKVNDGLTSLTIYTIAFDPKNDKVIYSAGFKTGICVSNDGGETWKCSEKGLDGFNSIHSIAVHPDKPNFIVIGTIDGGVFISADGGKTWRHSGLKGAIVWTVHIE
ncbi:Uncharacterized protein JGI1_01939 [Candidatus Thermokryptus mobilis]|uniref:Sortilin N-terminal domain-containing protein n=1 Tax=Candidatus Thermokryptus mobilis TaxID=1643428 RepID=A0A0S4NAQ4_9BACT|nr:hypothetical protein [Candidatus Thermokryptus mobilis]CUU07928.1 Uncharacterized protein JGI1_01939 [Candidatus Thermokryptus mobilis]